MNKIHSFKNIEIWVKAAGTTRPIGTFLNIETDEIETSEQYEKLVDKLYRSIKDLKLTDL